MCPIFFWNSLLCRLSGTKNPLKYQYLDTILKFRKGGPPFADHGQIRLARAGTWRRLPFKISPGSVYILMYNHLQPRTFDRFRNFRRLLPWPITTNFSRMGQTMHDLRRLAKFCLNWFMQSPLMGEPPNFVPLSTLTFCGAQWWCHLVACR